MQKTLKEKKNTARLVSNIFQFKFLLTKQNELNIQTYLSQNIKLKKTKTKHRIQFERNTELLSCKHAKRVKIRECGGTLDVLLLNKSVYFEREKLFKKDRNKKKSFDKYLE